MGNVVTVLAIFFVPISLSTSIFGMNINELNQSGQSLWVFIVSTLVILAATMMIWGLMYQFQKYNSLPKKTYSHESKPWHTRLSCLLQIIFRGHIIWVWKSGVLISLFTNGRVAFLRSCASCTLRDPIGYCHDAHKPCGYIESHLGIKRYDFKCSTIEAVSER